MSGILQTLFMAASSAIKDAYFNYVTLLLHGDGTNGAQNNTFLDSSTNNFTITRNGNTTQGTFTPYGPNWSNYFDGASSYFTVPYSSTLAFGTGDFCVEFWLYWTGGANENNVIMNNASGGLNIKLSATNAANWALENSYVGQIADFGTAPTKNTWHHIAVTRSSGTLYAFIDGTQVYSGSNSTNFTNTNTWYIAANGYSVSTYYIIGNLSNLRIVVGSAVYTTTFTPSTTPLTAISGTSLLTCQSNRFIDNSSNAFALTVGGSPSIQRFSPFSPSSAYSTSVIGGSGYFDGSGDYLSVASNTAFNWGTGDGTMEWWFNAPSQSTNYPGLVGSADYSSSGSTNVRWDNTGYRGKLFIYINGGGDPILVNTSTLASNAWHHCAVVRASGVLYFYVDGVQSGSVAWTGTMNWSNGGFYVGKGFDVDGAQANFIGYISNVRNVKGTAVYTGSTYTVPTAPLTAITNTQLLLNYTNAGIYDNAMMNDLETVGDAQVSTSVVKFGTGSIAFDGAGDYLKFPKMGILGFGTGNFTIEMWVNPTANQTSYAQLLNKGPTEIFNLGFTPSSTQLNFYNGSFLIIASSSLTIGAWTHVALVRNSTTLTIYQNGVSVGSATYSTDVADDYGHIGCNVGETTYFFNGYIDDLRITKGYARYTANFTPPTAAFPNN